MILLTTGCVCSRRSCAHFRPVRHFRKIPRWDLHVIFDFASILPFEMRSILAESACGGIPQLTGYCRRLPRCIRVLLHAACHALVETSNELAASAELRGLIGTDANVGISRGIHSALTMCAPIVTAAVAGIYARGGSVGTKLLQRFVLLLDVEALSSG